ncbi:MAG: hypothetical protein RL757_1252 [Bacteroidota bacterium]
MNRTVYSKVVACFMLLLSMCWQTNVFAQSACTAPVTRQVTNAKSTNSNQWDDFGMLLTGIMSDNTPAAWLFQSGTTFVENTDGTARLSGTIAQFGNANRRFNVVLNLTAQTFTPRAGSPYTNYGQAATGWYYYQWGSATLTGAGDLAGASVTLARNGHDFQVGIGGDDQPEPLDQAANGGSGWFLWTIVSQPTAGGATLLAQQPGATADFNLLLSGTPATPCGGSNTCDNVTAGGTISAACVNGQIVLNNATLPTGGTGTLEYLWFISTDNCASFQPIPNTNTASLTVGTVSVNTCYLRCSRRSNCSGYPGESNRITVTPNQCATANPCLTETTPPVISGCPANISLTTTGSGAVASWTAPTATDACSTPTVTQTAGLASGATFPLGTTTVTYTARDARGNTSTCSFTVTVTATGGGCDNVTSGGTVAAACVNGQIVINNVTMPAGGTGAIEYLWFSSTSGCYGYTAIPNSNSANLTVGSVAVTTYYLRCARRAGCSAYLGESNCVTVTPTQCGTTGGGGTCRRFDAFSTNDICGSGSWQPYAMYLNINGQGVYFAAASLRFEINGTTATLSGNLYDPRTWQYVPVNVTYTGGTSTAPVGSPKIELCLPATASTSGWMYFTGMSGTVVIGGQSLTVTRRGPAFQVGTGANLQNVSDNGASGWFTLSNGIEGDFNIKLLNEVNCGTGGDPCLTETTPPVLAGCPANISLTTTGTSAVASWTAPTATDACSTPTVTQTAGLASGAAFPVGVTTVTYTARDARGNTATCSFTVTVSQNNPCLTETTPPVLAGCPANISLTTTGSTAVASWTAPTATDACSTPTVTQTAGLASGAAFPVGTTTVTYTARDARGNMATCSFTVTVTVVNTCGTAISIRPVTNTRTNCNSATGTNYVMLYNGVFYTAGTNLKFTERSDNTATLAGNVHANGQTYSVNVTFSGRTCTSAGSPKLGDGNGVCGATGMNTANWYYYTTTTGTIGTVHGTVTINRNGPAFQVGNFANLQQNVMGASGWFTSNTNLAGDFNFNLGTCESCCSNPTVISCNNPPVPACNNNALGTLLYQVWNNHTDWSFPIAMPNRTPDHTSNTTSCTWGSRNADNYVTLIRGYIHPSVSGNYQFNIYGDDYVEMYFAQNDNPSNKYRICSINGWTNEHEWSKYSTQYSGSQWLNAGQKYYIEIRHKEGSGGDHIGLRWKLPNGTWEIIPGARCSPYCPAANNWNANSAVATLRLDGAAEALRARLEWVNNTGYKNDYFVVQKLDNSGVFADIEHIDANANDRNQDMHVFNAYDTKPEAGENSYRIKAVYDDGNFAISDIKTVKFTNVNTVNVFPNPADDNINVSLKQYEGMAVTLNIYDHLGKNVKQVQIEKVGSGAVEIDVADLQGGQYTIQVAADKKRAVVRKFQLMK